MNDGIETCFFDHMPEDAVRRWTAAYIAHAKKKHAEGWLQCSGCLSLHEGIVHFFVFMLLYRKRLPWTSHCMACAHTRAVKQDLDRYFFSTVKYVCFRQVKKATFLSLA